MWLYWRVLHSLSRQIKHICSVEIKEVWESLRYKAYNTTEEVWESQGYKAYSTTKQGAIEPGVQ